MYCKGQEPAYLGVSSWDGSTKTATVNTLVKNSPAEKAGLRIGDTIIKVGDINVLGTREIVKAENKYKIGEIVAVKVKRGLISKEFDVMLESYDPYK